MKKFKVFIGLMIICCIYMSTNLIYAADPDLLISVGTGAYKINVNKDSSINSIISVLGQPKLKTESAFGGHAYTFYTDSNYSNYLYIETTFDEKIISYGSVDPTFTTNTYSYNDPYPYTANNSLLGCICLGTGNNVGAAVFYNRTALTNGTVARVLSLFKDTYVTNETKYLKGISQHGVLMFNAFSKRLGKNVTLNFDEDLFYVNEQLKEFNSSIREYLIEMNKISAYSIGLGVEQNIELSNGSYYLLNPLLFANMARNTLNGSDFSRRNIAIFDYNSSKKLLTGVAVSSDLFDIADTVTLTTEEQSKLSSGRYEYNKAIENLNKESAIYDIIPVYSSPSGLIAGKLKASKVQGITDYINAIRVAGGIPKLSVDLDMFDVSQHISTLLTYRYVSLGLTITHMPAKPAGVSDTYYNQAIGYGKGYSENIGFSANSVASVNNMISYMNFFVDDSFESPQLFSHRTKLLNSKYSKFGFGISYMIGANEFGGTQANDGVIVEAWPSNGITFLETLINRRFDWTVKFVNKYTVKNNSTASIKCLNTGQIWNFNNGYEKTSTRWFECSTEQISMLNNKVIMYDSTIVPEPGYVYEITINGLQNNNTGAIESYTYRAAFEYADLDNYPTSISEISIKLPTEIVKVDDSDVYYVPVNEEIKFGANVDTSATDKKVTWISSNPNAVTVTQNGTVIANYLITEPVTITVCYDGTNITDQIQVLPYNKLDQVKLTKNEITLKAETSSGAGNGESTSLVVESLPEDATIRTVEWVVISSANPSVEYAVNDINITKYIKVTIDTIDPKKITIKAVTAEVGNNEYTVISKVKGINGTYTGSCKVYVQVPITSIRFGPISASHTIINNERLDIVYDPAVDSEYFNLRTTIIPENTSESTVVNWTTSNSSIVSVYDAAANRFKINKAGTVVLTAKAGSFTTGQTLTVNIRIPLKTISLGASTGTFKMSSTDISKNYLTPILTKNPSTSDDGINWTTSNSKVATVDSNGKINFIGEGTVVITATSKLNSSIKTTCTYTVYYAVESISITPSTLNIKKGESQTITINSSPSVTDIFGKVSYSYSDPTIARVVSGGRVEAMKAGTTIVTVTVRSDYAISGTVRNTFVVNVTSPLVGISLPDTRSIRINSTAKLDVTLTPSDTTDLLEYTWSSNQTDIVTVNPTTGIMTAKKLGTARITVSVKNKTTGNTFTSSTMVTVNNYLKGDVNKDGAVNSTDASIVMTLYKSNSATLENIQIGDMNEDGVLDVTDAAIILTVYKST